MINDELKIKFEEYLNNMSKEEKSKEFEIPVDGSIGLLALGDVGLKKWREVKAKFEAEMKNKKVEGKKNGDKK